MAVAIADDSPEQWRKERRLVDLHQHVGSSEALLQRAVSIMDRAGIGIGVNLSGGTVTHKEDEFSAFERNKALGDRLHPGRFAYYMNLDYGGWDEPGFSGRAVRQVEEGHRLGAAGLKEWKRLGLYLRDKSGKLIRVDDPRLDPVWRRCGELGLPVSIHVADPRAFWLPFNSDNERWTELKDHRPWWFGDAEKYPPRMDLLNALDRVVARHPLTTFVCVHFANNSEDIDWVNAALDRNPNMMADLAARIPEIGRHAPEKVHRLFVKHQDRILFATDFMVYNRLTLGSGGSGPAPTDDDALDFYAKHWRWLETWDRQFEHMTPIQGDWKIDAIGLPPGVLRKIYFDNARKLLVRRLPLPRLQAKRIEADFELDGRLDDAVWPSATPARIESQINTGAAKPEIATTARVLWSDQFLYIGYSAPYTELTVFEPPLKTGERYGLWNRDVVEAFIGTDPSHPNSYTEYEVAPNGEKLDLKITNELKPPLGLEWSSGFEAATHIDRKRKIWTTEMRIPLQSLSGQPPQPGTQWRINLYRHDRAHKAFLGWSPCASGSAHTPAKFGHLTFGS
ncbi:MAG: amidohydrolase family protein [Verrucomicrobiota bacterium]|nr:amidohydrolase family protein [Verrucomicrobiota bacterium]MDP7293434.1 amidohydrolase family protein [Verrucomicrobiota bacterium]